MAKSPATKNGSATPAKKSECPITKEAFAEKAKPLAVVINGETKVATPKEFASGSFGYFFNEKVVVMIDGIPVKLQANVILTVVGSKPDVA